MAKKITTLYIDDISLRLLVARGKQIKKWAELPLEPGLIKGNVVINEAEVAARIKQLFTANKVGAKKVIVGLSGLNCLTRPIFLPPLPKAMLDEAVTREARRVLPVPLEQLYISWLTIPVTEEKIQVFLIAIPRKTVDTLFKAVQQAGLKPYLMDLKPLALARVVKEATAIIVDAQPTEFDIVIMVDAVPQPIRTVPLPSEALSRQEKWLKVKEELDRTIQFYNSNNPEKPLAPDTTIFVSGELAEEPELAKLLSDEFGFPVLPLSSSPKCPGQLDSTHYLVNIGLALKEMPPGKETGPSLANVNALPLTYRPKPVPWFKIIALPSAIVFVGVVVLLTMFIQDASANVASMRSQLETTNSVLTQKQLKQKELTKAIAELDKKLAGVVASRDTFTAALSSLDRQDEKINRDLEVTANSLPSTVTLTGISHDPNRLVIQGWAPSELEVLDYARSLDASGRFSEITVTKIRRITGGMDFVLDLKTKG